MDRPLTALERWLKAGSCRPPADPGPTGGLSPDVLAEIFRHAADPQVARVCRRWRQVERRPDVWKMRATPLGIEGPRGQISLKDQVRWETSWPRKGLLWSRFQFGYASCEQLVVGDGETLVQRKGHIFRTDHQTWKVSSVAHLPDEFECTLVSPTAYIWRRQGRLELHCLGTNELIRFVPLGEESSLAVGRGCVYSLDEGRLKVWNFVREDWLVFPRLKRIGIKDCFHDSSRVLVTHTNGGSVLYRPRTDPDYRGGERSRTPLVGMNVFVISDGEGRLSLQGQLRQLPDFSEGRGFNLHAAARPRLGLLLLAGAIDGRPVVAALRWDTLRVLDVIEHAWGSAIALHLAEGDRVIMECRTGGACFRLTSDHDPYDVDDPLLELLDSDGDDEELMASL